MFLVSILFLVKSFSFFLSKKGAIFKKKHLIIWRTSPSLVFFSVEIETFRFFDYFRFLEQGVQFRETILNENFFGKLLITETTTIRCCERHRVCCAFLLLLPRFHESISSSEIIIFLEFRLKIHQLVDLGTVNWIEGRCLSSKKNISFTKSKLFSKKFMKKSKVWREIS